MDQDQINAMRAVVDSVCKMATRARGRGFEYVDMFDGTMPADAFHAAAEGLRTLVERAAVERAAGVAVEPAEPTLEECVAAMNRAKHRGWSDWELGATADDGTWLDVDELTGLGRLLIDRERAEAAKGGA